MRNRFAAGFGAGCSAALAAFVLAIAPSSAHAEFFAEFFRITCVPELGIFRFEVITIRGDVAERAVQDSSEEIAETYGLYDSGMLYDFVPSHEDPEKFVLAETQSRSVRCDLTANVIDIMFEPQILKSSVTAILTAKIDDIVVLNRFPFDTSDRDGRHIDTFSYTVGDPIFVLDGFAIPEDSAFPYGPQFLISKGYRFDGDTFEPLADFVTVYLEMLEANPYLNR